jgi:S-adenosyl methyltransferase
VPAEVDPGRPTAARMYDYLLGGSHNLPADRELVERALAARPDLAVLARANRAFLRRAARFLVGRGVRQFLDLGSGIPTEGNVHEIVLEASPRSRVVYVDVDPVAVAHGRALLAGERRVAVVEGDLRRPREVLDTPVADGLLDLSEPVAVLLVSVLQFVADTDDPWTVLSRLRETVPSGSHLALVHPVLTGRSGPDDALLEVYRRAGTPVVLRDVEAVRRFFDGWQLVEPGLVPVPDWRPESAADPAEPAPDPAFYAGVAVKA